MAKIGRVVALPARYGISSGDPDQQTTRPLPSISIGCIRSRREKMRCAWLKRARRSADDLDICIPGKRQPVEQAKSGVAPEAVRPAGRGGACRCAAQGLRGLNGDSGASGTPRCQRRRFAQFAVRLLSSSTPLGFGFDTLSDGMSQDLEAAVMEGATTCAHRYRHISAKGTRRENSPSSAAAIWRPL